MPKADTTSSAPPPPAPPPRPRPEPGVTGFCQNCAAFGGPDRQTALLKDNRCHLMPPTSFSGGYAERGLIREPTREWCWQHKAK